MAAAAAAAAAAAVSTNRFVSGGAAAWHSMNGGGGVAALALSTDGEVEAGEAEEAELAQQPLVAVSRRGEERTVAGAGAVIVIVMRHPDTAASGGYPDLLITHFHLQQSETQITHCVPANYTAAASLTSPSSSPPSRAA